MPNWSGPYAPCKHHSDLINPEHIDLGVRISTSNTALAHEFERAMDFWAGVLDMDWHEVDSEDCSIQLVDGTPQVFNSATLCGCLSARSQFPDRPNFEGWIAFNPALKFSRKEMFLDSVHEIGHLFGLEHNPSSFSVMYFSDVDTPASLDATDLESLAAHHKLRAGILERGGGVLVTSGKTASRDRHLLRP